MTHALKPATTAAPGRTVTAMVLAGGLAFAAALAVTAISSSDARVRAGFEAALGSGRVASLPRPANTGSAFDPSAVHLSRHVAGDAATPVQGDSADRAHARHAASLGVLGTLPRTGERILLPTTDGRLETFEVTAVETIVMAAGEEEVSRGRGHAPQAIADLSQSFALVTLETVDAVGDGHPPRTIRMIVRGPAGDQSAAKARLPVKAL